jgi:hypothetical protein
MVDPQIPILKEWDWPEDLFLFVIVIFILRNWYQSDCDFALVKT